jgi:hypothetical protein
MATVRTPIAAPARTTGANISTCTDFERDARTPIGALSACCAELLKMLASSSSTRMVAILASGYVTAV